MYLRHICTHTRLSTSCIHPLHWTCDTPSLHHLCGARASTIPVTNCPKIEIDRRHLRISGRRALIRFWLMCTIAGRLCRPICWAVCELASTKHMFAMHVYFLLEQIGWVRLRLRRVSAPSAPRSTALTGYWPVDSSWTWWMIGYYYDACGWLPNGLNEMNICEKLQDVCMK